MFEYSQNSTNFDFWTSLLLFVVVNLLSNYITDRFFELFCILLSIFLFLHYITWTFSLKLELVIFCIFFNFSIFVVFLKFIYLFLSLDLVVARQIARNSIFVVRQLLDILFRALDCTRQIYSISIENSRELIRILFAIYIFFVSHITVFCTFCFKIFDFFFFIRQIYSFARYVLKTLVLIVEQYSIYIRY